MTVIVSRLSIACAVATLVCAAGVIATLIWRV